MRAQDAEISQIDAGDLFEQMFAPDEEAAGGGMGAAARRDAEDGQVRFDAPPISLCSPNVVKKTGKRAMTAVAVETTLAAKTCLRREDIKNVFSALSALIVDEVAVGGAETFEITQVVKLTLKHVGATKAYKQRLGREPFSRWVKGKPARKVIHAAVAKALTNAICVRCGHPSRICPLCK